MVEKGIFQNYKYQHEVVTQYVLDQDFAPILKELDWKALLLLNRKKRFVRSMNYMEVGVT